jgi:hypothetical protein
MKKLLLSMFALAIIGAGTARAFPLQQLFDGADLIVDDKRFFDWTLLSETASSGAELPDYNLIEVTGLMDDPGTPDQDPGIRFQTNDQMTVVAGDPGEFIDIQLGFAVQSRGKPIKDNSLEITGFDFVGPGVITIIEEVFSDGAKEDDDRIAEKSVEADSRIGPPFLDLFDSAMFDPLYTVWVEKNILVAADPGGLISLDAFDQRFSQVPVPSVFLLIGAGLLPLGISTAAHRRRQRRWNG